MKKAWLMYGDYLIFILILLIKMIIVGPATGTYFGIHLFFVSLGAIILISFWSLWISPRIRRWVLFYLSILLTILIASNIWYYRYFTDLLSVALIIQIPQMGAVGGGLEDLIYPADFLLFADSFIWAALRLKDRKRSFADYPAKRRSKAALIAAVTGIVLFFTPLVISAADRDEWLVQDSLSNMRNYFKLGMIGHHILDIGRELDDQFIEEKTLTASQLSEMQRFFDSNRAGSADEALDGKPNVIVIQLESFQNSVLDQEIDGQEITPFLNDFKNEVMYFPNFYHQTHQGRTSDAEFILNTSFYPLKAGSVYTRYPDHSYDSLPEKMESAGYETAAFHAFEKTFWNRDEVYENFGFDHFYSIADFPEGDIIGLTLNDEDFFLSSVDRMVEMNDPFYAFMVALTSHTPYDFPDDKKELNLDSLEEEIIQNYYHNIHFVDRAFGSMVEKLKDEGIWEDALVVAYGDHDSGLQEPERDMAEMAQAESAVDYLNLGRKVPLFMKLPGMQDGSVMEQTGGQMDIAPTILSLLGLDKGYMMGNSLLSEDPRLTVFRDGSFIYDDYYYKADLTSERENGECYSLDTEEPADKSNCSQMLYEAASHLRMSDTIIKKNGVGQLQGQNIEE
ncbi:LTA synthase family protein [Jeotgalibacillus haloalkalitolerans]|uniref:LTA synthase family protein n=1 Tax=Jeotgalibacillus haloalkalitolerans TaxID=3104292 RepID=A0ABU5KQ07_9BACL|nr:LTA synthase family protein [Jeotgalibacillus sp. HH7-29]MDZ5713343.1 LTA synthase family protein [Jeotgalibacillus sp. HH7-29]